jgi:hypothetical protein
MVREKAVPFRRDEHSCPFFWALGEHVIAPHEQPPLQVDLLQSYHIQESPELSHASTVKTIIVFVLSTVDHVKISAKHLRPVTLLAQAMKLL